MIGSHGVKRGRIRGAVALLLLGLPAAAFGADGSGTDNPDLLRGPLGAGCMDDRLCAADNGQEVAAAAPAIALDPTLTAAKPASALSCEELAAKGLDGAACGEAPKSSLTAYAPAGPAPADDGLFGDWSVGLRGTVVASSASGARFEAVLSPKGSLTFERPDGSATLSGAADLVQGLGEPARVGSLTASVQSQYAIDPDLDLSANGALGLSQDAADPLVTAPAITTMPVVASGSGEVGLSQRLGAVTLGGKLNARRAIYATTGYDDGSWADNSFRNETGFGGGLSAEVAATPILSVFGEVTADRAQYDAASPSLGAFEDAWTFEGRAGLRGAWSDRGKAEIWAGYFQRRFDAGTLAPVEGPSYGGSLNYTLPSGLNLDASVETSVAEAGDVPGATARVSHSGTIGASYPVNDWMRLRASGSLYRNELPGTAGFEQGYAVGAGVDWQVARQIALSADYSYGYDETQSAADRSQRVTLGATVSR